MVQELFKDELLQYREKVDIRMYEHHAMMDELILRLDLSSTMLDTSAPATVLQIIQDEKNTMASRNQLAEQLQYEAEAQPSSQLVAQPGAATQQQPTQLAASSSSSRLLDEMLEERMNTIEKVQDEVETLNQQKQQEATEHTKAKESLERQLQELRLRADADPPKQVGKVGQLEQRVAEENLAQQLQEKERADTKSKELVQQVQDAKQEKERADTTAKELVQQVQDAKQEKQRADTTARKLVQDAKQEKERADTKAKELVQQVQDAKQEKERADTKAKELVQQVQDAKQEKVVAAQTHSR
jgi:hypothetical protein